MNKIDLLKKLIPGLLPLFIFIAVDEIWGTMEGLVVAIIFGIAELLYFYFKEKKVEKFVLIDTSLIVFMGAISLISANDIFFKLKPAIIQMVLCVFLFISAYTPKNLLLMMSVRYFGETKMQDTQLHELSKMSKWMFWLFTFHTLLIIYAAFYLSKEAWGFISGIMLYLILGVYFLINLFLQKRKASKVEWVPLVNEKGEIIGKATRQQCHSNPELIHPIARMHIFNSSGQIYLQKRLAIAETAPNLWDAAVAGHIKYGETVEVALQREAFEEMNLKSFNSKPIKSYIFKTQIETELLILHYCIFDQQINPNYNEVQSTRFFTIKQIEDLKNSAQITLALEMELQLLIEISKSLRQ